MCSIIGGNWPLTSRARVRLPPSRTFCAATTTWARITRLAITSAPMPRASTSGTPLRVRIARVEAKRAVSVARTSRPTRGMRNTRACQRWRRFGSRNAQRAPTKAMPSTRSISQPQCLTRSLRAIRPRVSRGRVCPESMNTLTTSGTTNPSRKATIANDAHIRITG